MLFTSEVATDLINKGITPGKTVSIDEFQELVLREQLKRERAALKEARQIKKRGGKPIIICDRGCLDGMGYTTKAAFHAIVKKLGLSVAKLRERYLIVIHLRTAAIGAESFYTLANNPARYETTLEAARTQDERTLEAWNGHHRLRVIPNEPGKSFKQKIDRALKEIYVALGIPKPLEIERAFDIELPRLSLLPPHAAIDIVQDYLLSPKNDPSVSHRIRKRTQDGWSVYVKTKKQKLSKRTRIETERHISKKEYERLLKKRRDLRFRTIRKTRICFIWEHQYFELDIFHAPKRSLARLEIELREEKQKIALPPFLTVIRETQESNRDIALLKPHK